MPNKLFFSVVIPLYNKAPHVARSIASVLHQTCQDFELIIVNDASTDGSVEEVLTFRDPRIRLLNRSFPGPGGYAARNLGIKEARAEWVAFLDADDEWYPDHLEKMRALSARFPEVVFMGCGWCNQVNGRETKDGYYMHFQSRGPHTLSLKEYLRSCLGVMQPVCTSVSCVRRSSPVALDLFPADMGAKRAGDRYAWLKMICRHKEMAWSDHIGATYFQDSVNMVTRTASGSPDLMSRKCYQELSENFEPVEASLLAKYFNKHLRLLWLGNIIKNGEQFRLLSRLYWKGDMRNALLLSATSLLPATVLRFLYYGRKWLRSRSATDCSEGQTEDLRKP